MFDTNIILIVNSGVNYIFTCYFFNGICIIMNTLL